MSREINPNQKKIRIISNPVDKSSLTSNVINIPIVKTLNQTGSLEIKLLSRIADEWNPFEKPAKCIICWKPIGIDDPYMECPRCGQKGHQVHILNWLSTKPFCPYCREKW